MSRSTYYRWKADISQPTHHDSLIEKIENLCVKNKFIYGYRTIRDLLMNEYGIIVNVKKVYRIMKKNCWLCRTRPKKKPCLGKPYYVTNNKLTFLGQFSFRAFSLVILWFVLNFLKIPCF
ncbi:IS3 family transposase [Streptococcus didelphis]|uniref:IS3 family transposase n=1 Tax=Streptococcus TaxID=1301 RepID=UPI0027D32406|nr:IS3 family transposase [Streptococcus didelphis]WMB29650.1 IS3 family transposase [Streptococcus didelphis]